MTTSRQFTIYCSNACEFVKIIEERGGNSKEEGQKHLNDFLLE